MNCNLVCLFGQVDAFAAEMDSAFVKLLPIASSMTLRAA